MGLPEYPSTVEDAVELLEAVSLHHPDASVRLIAFCLQAQMSAIHNLADEARQVFHESAEEGRSRNA